jgi:hypothetical protein
LRRNTSQAGGCRRAGFFGLRNFTLANAMQRYICEGRVGVESQTERKCSAPNFFGEHA